MATTTWLNFSPITLPITSRSDAEVMHPLQLQALDPTVIDASSNENEQDIIEYLYSEIRTFASDDSSLNHAMKKISEQSEGMLLYADWTRQDLANNRLSLDRLDEFPQGLGGIYSQFFRRKL
jgi:hypothetical protein